ncbi:hypothetical protein [Treponema sp.]|uniref:hypothetical protein n=1 Tax=Treponema sp. TaxID=166 RepID=UPI003FD7B22F
MKKYSFLVLLFLLPFCVFAREAVFDGNYNSIKNGISIINKTKQESNLKFLICDNEPYGYSLMIPQPELEYKLVANETIVASEKKEINLEFNDEEIDFTNIEHLKIIVENENITFEVANTSKGLKVTIFNMPTFKQISNYPRYNSGWDDIINIPVEDNKIYSVVCLKFMCQKNEYSENLTRYVCFYDYELGKGEKGTPEYLKYRRNLICKPYFTKEQKTEVEDIIKQIYKKNVQQYERIKENLELNQDNLNYHMNEFETISTFSRNHEIGKKYLMQSLNYYDVRDMGDNNYDIYGTYSRAIFHSNNPLGHFTMSDYQRILTYLGNIDVVRDDGVKMSLPYYECSASLEEIDRDIVTIVKQGFDWQHEIYLTDEVKEELRK